MMVRTGHDATHGAEARGAIRVACGWQGDDVR